jgi:methionyl-tRNA formyltransferase
MGTPVKQKAVELGIETFQPESIKKDYRRIVEEAFDFIIVAAYGQIIPDQVLYHGRYQAINVHASLLPKYRGGTPMHHAIIDGLKETGVSIMYMVKKMDAGDVLAQEKIAIDRTDDVASLELKLADLGSQLLVETMNQLVSGNLKAKPQDESIVSYAFHFKPEEKILDFNRSAKACFNQVRGMHPWPIAEMIVNGQKIKVYQANYIEEDLSEQIGEVVRIDRLGVYIQTSSGLFVLKEIQLQGKKRMDIQAFMNGLGRDIFVLNKAI